ncbi:GSCFA domain-containing protein [Dyadobacter aurulentus]|uniref:GSCFA domain-containing protein n=1 Tax=Dyadobacter sp. UC 10 TaxID=2605428 RepID=UPI0011F1AC34|nr:GSCFA domain-containing protein [Dyadobacter sp. UC 10]KAA0989517.1 GSCFA domain-containing protein [Dyadobacter sp. UC 10]
MREIKLSTEVNIIPSEWKIDHKSKVLTIGSCFAEVLGSQLNAYKFPVLNNPLGTIFNPLTICKTLDLALDKNDPAGELFLKTSDDIWLHHDFHSSLWSNSRAELESQLVRKLSDLRTFITEADVLVITLGTAYGYRHKATNMVIGNCHKLPAEHFIRELLHPDQISMAMELLIQKLLMFRRNLRVVLTVSPVRHTRDTLPLNQVSKSTLRLACHRLAEKYKHISYFPSYEIMIDELRDYRFYKNDLIHPNELAEEHIFQSFAKSFIEPDSLELMQEWDKIMLTINHRPLHGFTKSHLKFLKSVWSKLNEISRKMNVAEEMEEIERRIGEFPVL